jgi:4-amino-4-deoxy-L-arabinose transferase-like glycosyltransferase
MNTLANKLSMLFSHIKRWSQRTDLIILLLSAILIRVIFLAASNNQGGIDRVLESCFDCRHFLHSAFLLAQGTEFPEHASFTYGPGYLYFLALLIRILGYHQLLLILINILISSLSCLLIYRLSMILIKSYTVSIIAGWLACLSYTSITYSCVTMSDTFYFFLFTLALLFFLYALKTEKWSLFIVASLLFAYAALTRSIGQFWPIVLIIISVIWIFQRLRRDELTKSKVMKLYIKTCIPVIIIFVVSLVWIIRNHQVHGVYTLAITSSNGPANVAATTIERLTGKYSKETMQEWIDECPGAQEHLGQLFTCWQNHAANTFDTLGIEMIKTYISIFFINLNEINRFHRVLIPDFNHITIPLEKFIIHNGLNYIYFFAAIAGLVILIWRRHFWAAVILGGVYFYHTCMIGAFRWQGARYALPTQIAADIFIAITILFIIHHAVRIVASDYQQPPI